MSLTSKALPTAGSDLDERAFLRSLGKRIRLLRVEHELSQEQLAHAAGMSRNFVSSIERGIHGIDIVRLLRLAAAFGISLDALLSNLPPAPSIGPQPIQLPA
jgi:transcriptional regulator with XRE-family HTH domain